MTVTLRSIQAGMIFLAAVFLAVPAGSAEVPRLPSIDAPRPPFAERLRAARERVEQVAQSVYLITAEVGSNVALFVDEDGLLVIDTQFAPLSERLAAAIRSVSDKPIRMIVNTHGHPDHAGGNAALAEPGALLIGQELIRKAMASDQPDRVNGGDTPAFPTASLPKVTFGERLTLHLSQDDVELRHMSPVAHTQGDTVVFFRKANVLVTGDLFSNRFYPGFDVDRGGNIDGVIRAQTELLELVDDSTRIIPGHGPLATKADLQTSRDMLIEMRDRVTRLVREGKSEAEVIAARPTADFDTSWRQGGIQIVAFTRELYADARRREAKTQTVNEGAGP